MHSCAITGPSHLHLSPYSSDVRSGRQPGMYEIGYRLTAWDASVIAVTLLCEQRIVFYSPRDLRHCDVIETQFQKASLIGCHTER